MSTIYQLINCPGPGLTWWFIAVQQSAAYSMFLLNNNVIEHVLVVYATSCFFSVLFSRHFWVSTGPRANNSWDCLNDTMARRKYNCLIGGRLNLSFPSTVNKWKSSLLGFDTGSFFKVFVFSHLSPYLPLSICFTGSNPAKMRKEKTVYRNLTHDINGSWIQHHLTHFNMYYITFFLAPSQRLIASWENSALVTFYLQLST